MTLLTIILTVSLVLAGSYATRYLVQHVSRDSYGRSPAAVGVVRTGRERLRFLRNRLRLAMAEMNYAARRIVELQAPPFSDDRPNH